MVKISDLLSELHSNLQRYHDPSRQGFDPVAFLSDRADRDDFAYIVHQIARSVLELGGKHTFFTLCRSESQSDRLLARQALENAIAVIKHDDAEDDEQFVTQSHFEHRFRNLEARVRMLENDLQGGVAGEIVVPHYKPDGDSVLTAELVDKFAPVPR